jgi:hypothetical protein
MDTHVKQAEELKRERAWNAAERWKQMQDFLNWAEANVKPEQRRNRPRWRDEQGFVHYY